MTMAIIHFMEQESGEKGSRYLIPGAGPSLPCLSWCPSIFNLTRLPHYVIQLKQVSELTQGYVKIGIISILLMTGDRKDHVKWMYPLLSPTAFRLITILPLILQHMIHKPLILFLNSSSTHTNIRFRSMESYLPDIPSLAAAIFTPVSISDFTGSEQVRKGYWEPEGIGGCFERLGGWKVWFSVDCLKKSRETWYP